MMINGRDDEYENGGQHEPATDNGYNRNEITLLAHRVV